MIHYPRFKNHVIDSNGRISQPVAEEWMRRLGYLELKEALDYLDEWLDQPEDRRKNPPDTSWFSQTQRRNREIREAFKSEGIGPYMIDKNGFLTNMDGMIFAIPQEDDAQFYYNARGDIAYRNSYGAEIVAVSWEEANARRAVAEQMKAEADQYKKMQEGETVGV